MSERLTKEIRRALEFSLSDDQTCEHRHEGQVCGGCEGCDARRAASALTALDELVATLERERDEARAAEQTALKLYNDALHERDEALVELEMTNRLVGSVTDIQWAIAVRAMRARCIGNDEAALRWLDKMARYLVTAGEGGDDE